MYDQEVKENKIRQKVMVLIMSIVTMLGCFLHGLCTFPKMVINMNIAVKSENKNPHDLDCYLWC